MTKTKSLLLIELPTISAIFRLFNLLTPHFAEIIAEKIPGATRRGLSMPYPICRIAPWLREYKTPFFNPPPPGMRFVNHPKTSGGNPWIYPWG